MGVPRDIKKEAERIAMLIFRNQKFDDAIDLIATALTAERERQAAAQRNDPSPQIASLNDRNRLRTKGDSARHVKS